jgi:hypothetical protein
MCPNDCNAARVATPSTGYPSSHCSFVVHLIKIDNVQLFETLDEDGNKWLHVRELQKALVRVNYDFDAHAVQALTRIFAGGRRGNTALNKQQVCVVGAVSVS